ncbi:gephyrin-like molybdotransferase receptor GlpR [Streptomyces sp. NPDC001678]|uniref:divisome protein SepX/GlpR n=1 Tax=Streptomyces sp. NPDC001678 TaxID=3364599 RepID=UPI0036770754
MSSSGLIYAVIVGAWAAYLVPMWLRRQDELNEARPTERFSTAIRLLSGRAGMERRYAKDLEGRVPAEAAAPGEAGEPEPRAPEPEAATEMVDVRSFGAPASGRPDAAQAPPAAPPASSSASASASASASPPPSASPSAPAAQAGALTAAERARRSKVLARRRRTTVLLFLAFSLGAVVAGVGGLALLWVPGVPAALLSAYICYLRVQERRRFAFTMDQRRAELAAQRLREGRARSHSAPPEDGPADADTVVHHTAPPAAGGAAAARSAGRRALVEQTDHAEWVDQQRDRDPGEGWEPVPVPLPTYVSAPVAPRATGAGAADTWSSARSSTAEPADAHRPPAEDRRSTRPRRPRRERGHTPLFDQYADEGRPRAANE